ncbi:Homeobox-leucine zipper protein [Actinidia chinensis var. chinensis]|uniref:Homeobox-leucine zipper protein n=1 Tax=Actinidia chinensis var. chinensis TaxID=1590841 RepID=A0A2R6QTG6_ACTCC|nr:Homeobox-leucine zipper protein [Actinidia chinensis var. chinensis]
MPAGIINPATARRMATSMIGGSGFGSSSGLTLGQPNMMTYQLNPLDMAHSTADSDVGRVREEEFDSKSGSENHEGGSGNEQDPNQRPRKKRYHRHTQHQIQEMEAFFKECPHPDDKQRKELSRELRLEPLQIKFWFQNKRTQMKMQHERLENTALRNENDKLRSDNMKYREALSNASCLNCGGPTAVDEMSFDEQHLRVENSRLREEIDRISAIAAKYVGKPVANYPIVSPPITPRSLELGNFGGELYGAGDLVRSIGGPSEQSDKQMIIELAVAAMEELTRMAQLGELLWIPGIDSTYLLNEEEYFRIFPRGIGSKPLGFRSEASRESAVVIMNPTNLVEILMDANQWSTMFSGIVSRAMTLEVLSTGVAGNFNGALQVMTAEFHVLSPVVPTRESYFVRYCKQHVDGSWAVVDVSLDSLRPNPLVRCRRRPSGCLIQELPNGYSQVTWIEHVEVDDRGVHSIYRPLVNSGLAFGAKRWVCTLDRQCERLAIAMATNLPPTHDVANSVISCIEGKRSLLKLSERMVMSFCGGVSASNAHTWTTLSGSGADDVRVMTRKSVDDPGRPPGIVLSAATSFWLPVPPKRVYEFFRDEHSRNEWDILSNGGMIQEMERIAIGRETGNCISLLRVNTVNRNQNNMLILQESCIDQTGSYIIYSPVDVVVMNLVLGGGDPDFVPILPSGFSILPDGLNGEGGSSGSLLTVAFQILVDSSPNAKLSLGSVATVNNLITCSVERIKGAVASENL